jgi:hypothetical protein
MAAQKFLSLMAAFAVVATFTLFPTEAWALNCDTDPITTCEQVKTCLDEARAGAKRINDNIVVPALEGLNQELGSEYGVGQDGQDSTTASFESIQIALEEDIKRFEKQGNALNCSNTTVEELDPENIVDENGDYDPDLVPSDREKTYVIRKRDGTEVARGKISQVADDKLCLKDDAGNETCLTPAQLASLVKPWDPKDPPVPGDDSLALYVSIIKEFDETPLSHMIYVKNINVFGVKSPKDQGGTGMHGMAIGLRHCVSISDSFKLCPRAEGGFVVVTGDSSARRAGYDTSGGDRVRPFAAAGVEGEYAFNDHWRVYAAVDVIGLPGPGVRGETGVKYKTDGGFEMSLGPSIVHLPDTHVSAGGGRPFDVGNIGIDLGVGVDLRLRWEFE